LKYAGQEAAAVREKSSTAKSERKQVVVCFFMSWLPECPLADRARWQGELHSCLAATIPMQRYCLWKRLRAVYIEYTLQKKPVVAIENILV
jgi:hypothetical protein